MVDLSLPHAGHLSHELPSPKAYLHNIAWIWARASARVIVDSRSTDDRRRNDRFGSAQRPSARNPARRARICRAGIVFFVLFNMFENVRLNTRRLTGRRNI